MTLKAKIKISALLITASTTLIACDSLQITGGPLGSGLALGAAQGNNLLANGGFDNEFQAWQACGDPSTVTLSTDDENTASSAKLLENGCLYQLVPAQVNDNMIATCSARKTSDGINWASMTFGYLDENHQPIKTVDAPIPSTNFTTITATLRAPENTAYAEVLVYAENGALVDDCELVNTQQGLPTELLLNAWFEDGLNGWQTCSLGTASVENDVANINGSCISQRFTAQEGVQLTVSCDGIKLDDMYGALALGFLDESTQPVELSEAALSKEAGSSPRVTLTAPATTSYAQVMIYTDGEANLNSCSLTQIEPRPES